MLRNDVNLVRPYFNAKALARICTMPEKAFGKAFDMDKYMIETPVPDNFYFYRDNGSDVLAVAHLDTVAQASKRKAHFVETQGGLVVFSRALDDRLGAYTILDLLPQFGVTCDWLLTVGEETGNSTAQFFDPPKQYNWMIEFDRGGTDVVMYQYDDEEVRDAVHESGAVVGDGIFSDICYLEHLNVKGFNWGVGYRDYHGPRSHAYVDDTCSMVAKFLRFHEQNESTHMPHYPNWSDDGIVMAEAELREGFWNQDWRE